MKKWILVLMLGVIGMRGIGQVPTWEWAIGSIGTQGSSNGGMKLKVGNSGNIYVMGNFNDDSVKFDQITLFKNSSSNLFLNKYDPNGNLLFSKSLGIGSLQGRSMSIDAYENIYITGNFGDSVKIGSTTLLLINNVGPNIFIAKFDSSGNSVWAKSNSSVGYNQSRGINADNLGNIYVFGDYASDSLSFGSTTLFTTFYSQFNNDQDLFLTKFDSSGNPKWIRGGFGITNYGMDVSNDGIGNVLVTGFFSGNFIHFDTISIYDNHPGWTDVFIAKYDSSGNILWAKSEGGNNQNGDESWGINATSNGNIYVAGDFSPNSTFDTVLLSGHGIFLAQYDPNGVQNWIRSIVSFNTNTTLVYGLCIDNSDNAYITGYYTGDSLQIDSIELYNNSNLFSYIGNCPYFAKFDHHGNFNWARNGIGDGVGHGIGADNNSNVYVSGSNNDTMSFGSIILPYYYGSNTTFVAKLGIPGAGIPQLSHQPTISLFPNPFSTTATLLINGE